MAKYLKTGKTFEQFGLTLQGNSLGNQGVLAIVGFTRIEREAKRASVLAHIYIDNAAKDANKRLCDYYFDIEGDDFDTYINAAPTEDELDKYLLFIHRAYKYMSDKADIDSDNPDYVKFALWTP